MYFIKDKIASLRKRHFFHRGRHPKINTTIILAAFCIVALVQGSKKLIYCTVYTLKSYMVCQC